VSVVDLDIAEHVKYPECVAPRTRPLGGTGTTPAG
jgi:hypothetical protein